jgi:hypothetical protein
MAERLQPDLAQLYADQRHEHRQRQLHLSNGNARERCLGNGYSQLHGAIVNTGRATNEQRERKQQYIRQQYGHS